MYWKYSKNRYLEKENNGHVINERLKFKFIEIFTILCH